MGSDNGFSVEWERYYFTHIFIETIIAIRGRQIFLKILFLLVKTIFLDFFRHWFKWKQFFGPLKSYFSTNPSFWLVQMVFG